MEKAGVVLSTPFYMKKKVLAAVSGGVDSITALLILREEGYDVAAAHMKLWDYADVGGDSFHDGRCCSLEAINDLQIICNSFSIPFYVFNLSGEFKKIVINNFVSEYKAGRTPNPCILCNTHLKWSIFLRKAIEIGCEYIATGHYARLEYDNDRKRFVLRKGIDATRDQSYALWGLGQGALSHTLLPLGKYLKLEVRQLARKFNLKNAEKPESREICFIADDDYHRFLREWEEKHGGRPKAGDIVFKNGAVAGRHQGIQYYTIGQRKGLGLSNPTPLYVNRIDVQSNRVIIGDEAELYSARTMVRNINWVSIASPAGEFPADVKIRYLHQPAPAIVKPIGENASVNPAFDGAEIEFETQQRAITPGQSAVFYDGEVLLGGGIIDSYPAVAGSGLMTENND